MACDRARVVLQAEERPASAVASKVAAPLLTSALPLYPPLVLVFLLGSEAGGAPYPSPPMSPLIMLLCSLKSKKSVVVAETPSAVFHYEDSTSDETAASRKTDAIFRAAKKDLLTLMKLDVSSPPPAFSLARLSGERCTVC